MKSQPRWLLLPVLIVVLTLPSFWTTAAVAQTPLALSLPDAIELTLRDNPELQVLPLQREKLVQAKAQAELRPPLNLQFELENFLGNGDLSGTDSAEYTLALASVIELGGKRDARLQHHQAQTTLEEARQQSLALDRVGALTQTFIATLATQEQLQLAQQQATTTATILDSVMQRNRLGASANTEVLRVQASLEQAQIDVATLRQQLLIQQTELLGYWGQPWFDLDRLPLQLQGNLYAFDEATDFEQLLQRVNENPNLQVLANTSRLQQAAVTLAESSTRADLNWSLGARHLAENGDTALVASISAPLFTEGRQQNVIERAQLDQQIAEQNWQQQRAQFYRQLFSAYVQRQQWVDTARRLNQSIIPALSQVLVETEQGYNNGRYSYLELSLAQAELFRARKQWIEVAAAAQQAQAVIEHITATPLAALPKNQ